MNPSICHILAVYDGVTEELTEAEEIRLFDLHTFRQQFDVPVETDPEMLDRYAVGPDDASFVCKAIGRQISFDFSRFAYFIEAAKRDI